ncbi:ribonuclease P protein component [bacterium]|nr:ribonuclease P protein component [bacterium]
MLSKQYRLQKSSAFTATYRVKNSFYLGGVAVFVGLKKKVNDEITRVGFVVSKKTHKRAVKRNRLKRLMRESYRLFLKSDGVGNSKLYKSLIFVGHEKALDMKFSEMQKTMKYLLEQIND